MDLDDRPSNTRQGWQSAGSQVERDAIAARPFGLRNPDTHPREQRPLEDAPHVSPAVIAATTPIRRSAPAAPRAAGPAYRGLPTPVKAVLWIAATIGFGAVIGATAPTVIRRIAAVAAIQPGLMAWYTARTMGFMAYLVVAGSVIYGLLLSTKILDAIAHRPVSFALHKDLALAGLFLAMVHATVLLADQSYAFTPRAILVPFASPYAPLWVGIGQLTMYGLAIVTGSFYIRRQIGQRAWRVLHYGTFAVFVGTTIHGVMAGSDSGTPWAFWIYFVPGVLVFFMLVYRIVVSASAHLPDHQAKRSAVPALIARTPLPDSGRGLRSSHQAGSIDAPLARTTLD
jgi:hypothetical protein